MQGPHFAPTIASTIASTAAATGQSLAGAPLTLLCALSLAGLVVGPFATAATLRQGLD